MSQSIQPEKFVEIQSMAKAYVAELEGDENNVHVLPTMRDAAYNAYCDAYHDGFIAGASSLQGEVERLRKALEDIAAWKLPETGRFWGEERTDPIPYGAWYGSNGERDYMIQVATSALNK